MKVEESLNVTFDETPPPPKTSPLEDDELVEEEAIEVSKSKPIGNDLKDISLENNQIVNIKESKTHPLKTNISNLNQRTLRWQAQDKINFFCFISTIEPKNINSALHKMKPVLVKQEDLTNLKTNDVWELVLNPMDVTFIGTKWVYRNKLDENGVVTRKKLGDYVDRKSTSGVCMFLGCCLTSLVFEEQTASLPISTTEAEYVSAGKACQQALWMKQALIDYGVRLDDIPYKV
ncbi:hypothetical protein Tco_0161797 [Tanacetum coccineum]